MKQAKLIFMLVLVSAVLFSCSNARYGHMKKVKVGEKATVKKEERKKRVITPAAEATEEVAAIEATEAETVNYAEVTPATETVVAENTTAAAPSKTTKRTTTTVVAAPETNKSTLKNDVQAAVKENKEVNKEAAGKAKGKSQIIALILVALVGGLGIHRFYLGYTWQGVVQLLTAGGCGIWWLIDLVRIITGDLKPKDGEYDETF